MKLIETDYISDSIISTGPSSGHKTLFICVFGVSWRSLCPDKDLSQLILEAAMVTLLNSVLVAFSPPDDFNEENEVRS